MTMKEVLDFLSLEYGLNFYEEVDERVQKYFDHLKTKSKGIRKTKGFETFELERSMISEFMKHENIREGQAIRKLIVLGYLRATGNDECDLFSNADRIITKITKE